jgi:hypothetical protein
LNLDQFFLQKNTPGSTVGLISSEFSRPSLIKGPDNLGTFHNIFKARNQVFPPHKSEFLPISFIPQSIKLKANQG